MPDTIDCRVIEADLASAEHARIVLYLVRAFARDTMGDGQDLPQQSRDTLIDGLRQHPAAFVFLAFIDDDPAGYSACFLGFSTFKALPVLNVHDFFVAETHRRKGVGGHLMGAIEARATELGCCKLTLEVQQNNKTAQSLYHRFGFKEASYDTAAGTVLFRQKMLAT